MKNNHDTRFSSNDDKEYFNNLQTGLNFIENYTEFSHNFEVKLFNSEGNEAGSLMKMNNLSERYRKEGQPSCQYYLDLNNQSIADPNQLHKELEDNPIYSFAFIKDYLEVSDIKLMSIQNNGKGY